MSWAGCKETGMKKYLLICALAVLAACAPSAKVKVTCDPLKEITLRQDMRKLWTDHTVWTRGYIIAALNGSFDADIVAERLLRNQDDIGKAVAGYYGAAAGDQLTGLLKE